MGRGGKKNRKTKNMEAPDVIPISRATITLNNGNRMPKIGLGTFRIGATDHIMELVDEALKAGYRLFDTAAAYENEAELGEAFKKFLPKYDLQREDIFITTKLSPYDHGKYQVVKKAYEKSLENLGMDYVDLYLIHFPGAAKVSTHNIRNSRLRDYTWQAMIRLYDEGRANSIGVSNFTIQHLAELNIRETGVCPAVNQVELHPYFQQGELVAACRELDVCLQAYSSLGGASISDLALLQEPAVRRAAQAHAASPAQVLLAWGLQRDYAVIPKTVSVDRVRENIDIDFTLTDAQLRAIDALGVRNQKYAWDPTEVR